MNFVRSEMVKFSPSAQNLARREDALELNCDILIPAALEKAITKTALCCGELGIFP